MDFDVSKEHDMLTLLKTKDIRRAWTDEHDKSMNDLLQSADFQLSDIALPSCLLTK